MSRTVIALKFKMLWFPDEASNLPPLMPDEDNNFGGSLFQDLRK